MLRPRGQSSASPATSRSAGPSRHCGRSSRPSRCVRSGVRHAGRLGSRGRRIGSPISGLGMAGVAPNVTLVNIRAGQDSGFFFLQHVVNMSHYIDPWPYNCGNPLHPVPEDSPADRAEQKTIIDATRRRSLCPHPRGHAHRRGRQPPRGHHHPDARQHQPRLPAGHGARADGQQHLPRPPDRGHQRLVGRAEQDEGRLFQLGLRRDHGRSARRLVPRRGLAGYHPGGPEPDPGRVPEERR